MNGSSLHQKAVVHGSYLSFAEVHPANVEVLKLDIEVRLNLGFRAFIDKSVIARAYRHQAAGLDRAQSYAAQGRLLWHFHTFSHAGRVSSQELTWPAGRSDRAEIPTWDEECL